MEAAFENHTGAIRCGRGFGGLDGEGVEGLKLTDNVDEFADTWYNEEEEGNEKDQTHSGPDFYAEYIHRLRHGQMR